jgi:hypothetical protein
MMGTGLCDFIYFQKLGRVFSSISLTVVFLFL